MKDDKKLVAEFLTLLRVEKGLSENTLLAYRNDLQKLLNYAADNHKSLFSLDRSDLVDLMAVLKESGANFSSISRMVSAIRGFYKFALTEGLTKNDPTAHLESSKP